jgi:S1-C subfamily serine protease/uncharacterized membrane protein required for colicin V production
VTGLPFNLIDALAMLVLVLATWLGVRSGFVIQAMALAGIVVAIGLLVVGGDLIANLLANFDQPARTIVGIAIMLGVVFGLQAVGSIAGQTLRRRMGQGLLGGVDRGLGAAFGFGRGLFMIWLLTGLVTVLPLSGLAAEARGSLVVRTFETRFPSPVALAGELSRLFTAAGLPDIFGGAPPPVTERAAAPGAAEAQRIARTAIGSTYRVETLACDRFLSGSSFAIAGDYLVTNAHVVAGAEQVWVSLQGSLDRWRGTVVRFDPELDVALIYVARLDAAPLRLAARAPANGTLAAALGYTGGGPLQVIPAGVNRTIEAIGRDLYGRSVVTRAVIELNADVNHGDSGGPLVVANGQVSGVVFSESQSDPSIGYALTPDAVAASVDAAIGHTAAANTGACIN